MQASDWTANASFSSTAPMSDQPIPARASAFSAAPRRRVAEVLRIERMRGRPAIRRSGLADARTELLAAEQQGRCAVVQRRCVAGGDGSVGTERGLELGERSALVPGPDGLVPDEIGTGHGDHEVVVEACRPGPFGEVVRPRGEFVLACPGRGRSCPPAVRWPRRATPSTRRASLVVDQPPPRVVETPSTSPAGKARLLRQHPGARVIDSTPPVLARPSASPSSMVRGPDIAASSDEPHRAGSSSSPGTETKQASRASHPAHVAGSHHRPGRWHTPDHLVDASGSNSELPVSTPVGPRRPGRPGAPSAGHR